MEDESIVDIMLGSFFIGLILAFFAFVKLGALDYFLGRKELPRVASPQMQTEAEEVDHALLDEPHPNHPESRAHANKSGILE